jgi:hypothetical protein
MMLIHMFQSGSIQMVTEVGVDPTGDVWVANNWNVVDAVVAKHAADPISTKAAGKAWSSSRRGRPIRRPSDDAAARPGPPALRRERGQDRRVLNSIFWVLRWCAVARSA